MRSAMVANRLTFSFVFKVLNFIRSLCTASTRTKDIYIAPGKIVASICMLPFDLKACRRFLAAISESGNDFVEKCLRLVLAFASQFMGEDKFRSILCAMIKEKKEVTNRTFKFYISMLSPKKTVGN